MEHYKNTHKFDHIEQNKKLAAKTKEQEVKM